METNTKKKIAVYSVTALVFISIFLASYLDKDNTLKDEAIMTSDTYYCDKIKTGFIKEKCYKIVAKKLALLKVCHDKYGQFAKECNNLAY